MSSNEAREISLLVCIDDFRLSDLDDVVTIENLSFLVDAFKPRDFIELYERSENTFLVARTKLGAIAGYVVASVENGEGCLISIAVEPSYRRKGLAKVLLDVIFVRAIDMDAKTLMLHVNVENTTAVRLYEKLGFVVEQFVNQYYSDNSLALLMRISL